MTDQDPALAHTESKRSAGSLLALGLRDDGLDADELAAALPQYDDFRPLGAGGMGVVWSARHVQLDRRVAIKLLRPELAVDPSFSERFTREARALAKLQHPGIVGVHDFGELAGACFIVMELVDGTDLRSLLREGLTPEQALAIVPQLCDALQYAHDQGIVHRDIKPENILVDRKGHVKIADFGLAKLRATNEPSATSLRVLGTPHYMAPEQIDRPAEIDHRADIFALGVVIYEMLTGRLPVGRFDPPSRVRAVDVRLDEVVLRSLEHDRERRYQHASEVKDRVVALRPTPDRPRSTRDDIERRVEEERRRLSRWSGLALIGGFAYFVLRGLEFEPSGHFRYLNDRPGDLVTVAVAWIALWWLGLVAAARRSRGTWRGSVMQAKADLVADFMLIGLASVAAWKGSYGWSAGLLALALSYAYGVWAKATEQRIPAKLIFSPRWWITRFEAENDPRT